MGTHSHHNDYNFSEQFTFTGREKVVSLVALAIGVVTIAIGLLSSDHIIVERTYAILLLMVYYFTSVCAAGGCFLALDYVTQAGWSSGIMRIPHAMAYVLQIASLILLVIVLVGLFSHNLDHQWFAEGLNDPN